MSTTRTSVLLDDDLLKEIKRITQESSTTGAITAALEQVRRAHARNRLAELLGSDPTFEAAPRRRPE